MANLLILPPVAFLVMLAFVWFSERAYKFLAQKPSKPQSEAKLKPYACGEDITDHRAQPDYGQFFPFAFFFTIMHVVALVVTTLPTGSLPASLLAACFLVASAIGVYVLFRR